VPILAMSASVSASDSEQSLAAGMSGFLPKPLDVEKLLEQMARLLRLEWTYSPAKAEEEPIVTPPAEEMEILHRLAKLGNMHEIIEHANQLAKLDERYRPFVKQLSSLAKSYQSQAVLRLVEEHLQSGSALHASR
jgi:CheY-like chemotaxis protein